MKNLTKKILKIGGIVVAVLVVLLIILMVSIGQIAKSAINSAGAQMLGVSECSVGNVIFNPFGGKFGISKLKIGFPQANPDDKTYSKNVFEVEKISVNLDLPSLFSDTILIEELTVKGLVLNYEKPLTAGTNIDAIVAHLSGGNDDGNDDENAGGNAEKSEISENTENSENSENSEPSEEIYIAADKIDIDGAQVWVHVGPIPTPLPPLTINLKDVGKERKLTPAMFGVRVLMNFLNLLNRVDLGVVSDVAGTASDAAMDAAGTAVDIVGDAAGTATDAAKNAAGTAVDAAGTAVNAVGDAAGTLINIFSGEKKSDETEQK